MLDSDFDIAASAVDIFIGFCGAYKNSDCIKAAYTAHYNKDCSSDYSKDFLENPDERAETDKQKSYNEKSFCIAFRELVKRIWVKSEKHINLVAKTPRREENLILKIENF